MAHEQHRDVGEHHANGLERLGGHIWGGNGMRWIDGGEMKSGGSCLVDKNSLL